MGLGTWGGGVLNCWLHVINETNPVCYVNIILRTLYAVRMYRMVVCIQRDKINTHVLQERVVNCYGTIYTPTYAPHCMMLCETSSIYQVYVHSQDYVWCS